MIDYKAEATKIATAMLSSDQPTPPEILASDIIDLYRRAVAETWEEAAKVCDVVADKYRLKRSGLAGYDLAREQYLEEGSKECAAAIRSRKEGR